MSKKNKIYAVKKGHTIGLFYSWDDCKSAVEGFAGAVYKSFESAEEARAFLEDVDVVKNDDILPRLNKGKVVAFTDGSFDADKKAYGSGVCIFAPNDIYVELCNSGRNEKYIDLRNIAGEIIAVLNAIDWAWKNGYDQISIFYDYEGIGKWASGEWKAKTTLSSYYKRYIDDKNGIISIEFIKVSGHSNNKYNDRADKLAKSAIFENKVIRDLGGNSGYIISPVVEENIVSLLNSLKEDCQGLDYSSHSNGLKTCWTVTLNTEKVQITLYNNIKMTVQGKKDNLFQIVTTGIIETIQCGNFIQVLKSAYGIAENYLKMHMIDKAESYSHKAISMNKRNYKNYLTLGIVLKEKKMYKSAMQSLERARLSKQNQYKLDCSEAIILIDEINYHLGDGYLRGTGRRLYR